MYIVREFMGEYFKKVFVPGEPIDINLHLMINLHIIKQQLARLYLIDNTAV